MAVAFDAVGPAGGGGAKTTTAGPLTWAHINSAAGNVFFVGVNYRSGTSPEATAVSYGGVSLSRLGTVPANNAGPGGADLWGVLGTVTPLPTGSNTVSVTFSGGAGNNTTGGSVSLTGASSFGTVFTNFAPIGTSVSVNVTGTTTGNMIFAVASQGAGAAGWGVSGGGTQRWAVVGDFNSAADDTIGGTWASPGGTQAVGFTNTTGDNWAIVAVEVKAGAAVTATATRDNIGVPPGARHPASLRVPWKMLGADLPDATVPGGAVTAAVSGAGAVSAVATQIATATIAGAGAVSASTGTPVITGLAGTGAGYFADQNGQPRFVLGDAVWGLCGNAGRWNSGNWQADYDTFFTNRAAQGFTVIYTKPMGTTQNLGINDDGRTFDPLYPFQGGAPSTGVSNANPSSGLTSSYWARIDYMLNSALAKGITIFLNAIGYNSDFNGGPGPMAGKSTTEFTAYGTALGGRYKNQPNLIWNLSDDYFGGTTPDSLISAFLTGVRGAGDTHPVAIENMPESTSRKGLARVDTGCGTTNLSTTVTDTSIAASDVGARVTGSGIPANTVINSVTPGTSFVMNNQASATASVSLTILDYGLPWGTSNAQFNFTYSYNATYYGIERAYLEASPVTVIQGDGYFYQGNNTYQGGTGAFAYDHAIRQDAWHAISSGARGIIHGSESIWQYQSTALAASSTDWYYVNNAGNIRAVMESLSGWQTLVPDTSSLLVTAGRGTHASAFSSGGGGGQYEVAFTDTYVTASRTPDGGSGSSLAVIYMSHATTITIDQSKMLSGYTAKWVDPVTGATSTATTGTTYNSTAKGNNSRGEADWVLVLQGPTSSTGAATIAGAGAVAAVATVISGSAAAAAAAVTAKATQGAAGAAAGAGAVTAVAKLIAPATVAGAGSVTAVATQIAGASAAGAAAVSAVSAQAAAAAPAGAGAVTAIATQIAGAPPVAGAATVTAVATQIAPAAAAGAAAVSAAATQAPAAAVAGAAAVTAVATQIAGASAAGAGVVSATAISGATGSAAVAGAGAVSAVATQIPGTSSAAGTSAVTAVATQAATATAAGAATVTATSVSGGAGTAAIAGAGAVTAVVTLIVPATAAGAGAVSTAVTQAATGTAAGAGAVSAFATQAPKAAAAAAATVTAVATQAATATAAGAGAVSAQSVSGGAGSAVITAASAVTAVATLIVPAAVAGASAVTAAATQQAGAAAAGAAAVTAVATQIAGATVSAAAVAGPVPVRQIAGATAAGAAVVGPVPATQVSTASAAGASSVTAVASSSGAATATVAGAGSVTAFITVIATAAAAGAGAVATTTAQTAGASAAGASAVTSAATQIASASPAGAGSVTAVLSTSGAATASLAGAGAVTAVATVIATATAAGASAVTATVAQLGSAALQAASALTAAGQITGTANLAAAAAVTAKATQGATAQAARAAALTALSAQRSTAALAGAGVVSAAGAMKAAVIKGSVTVTLTDPREGLATLTHPREGSLLIADPREGASTLTDPREGGVAVIERREGSSGVS